MGTSALFQHRGYSSGCSWLSGRRMCQTCPGGCHSLRHDQMGLPVKQRQGSPSSSYPAPGHWSPSKAQRRNMTTGSEGRARGATCLLQSVWAIIPSTSTWETNWGEYCLVRTVFLLLYRIKSRLFHFVGLQDKSSTQLFVYQETTCLPFVKGLDCLWEILAWSFSFLPTEAYRRCRN